MANLSDAQVRVLRVLDAWGMGIDRYSSRFGPRYPLIRTLDALCRNGYVRRHCRELCYPLYTITPAGRAALAAHEEPADDPPE